MRLVAQRQLLFDQRILRAGDTVAWRDPDRPVSGRVLANLVARGLVGIVDDTEAVLSGSGPAKRPRARKEPISDEVA